MTKTDDVISWIHAAEHDGGGIAAWKDTTGKYHKPYPEVSGYLIPTLIHHGVPDLAMRIADWLESIQNKDGSWNGLDDKPRAFDTSAVIEGLILLGRSKAVARGLKWLRSQRLKNGLLRISPDVETSAVYNYRASYILGDDLEFLPSMELGNPERMHYIAYALEGMWRAGMAAQVKIELELAKKAISPFGLVYAWVRPGFENGYGSDTCATAQFSMLYGWAKDYKTARRLQQAVEGMIEPNGGVRHDLEDNRQIAWAAKFYLDAVSNGN